MEDNYNINDEKIQLETPKRHTNKSNDKIQENETMITQNIYEALIDSDGSDTKACDNDKDENSKTSREKHHHN